jgi:hypothetical protein
MQAFAHQTFAGQTAARETAVGLLAELDVGLTTSPARALPELDAR